VLPRVALIATIAIQHQNFGLAEGVDLARVIFSVAMMAPPEAWLLANLRERPVLTFASITATVALLYIMRLFML
jgi:hypothetical protein